MKCQTQSAAFPFSSLQSEPSQILLGSFAYMIRHPLEAPPIYARKEIPQDTITLLGSILMDDFSNYYSYAFYSF